MHHTPNEQKHQIAQTNKVQLKRARVDSNTILNEIDGTSKHVAETAPIV
jgi:hypothetical protein